MHLDRPFLTLFFLLGTSSLAGMSALLQRWGRLQFKEQLQKSPHLFFFYPALKFIWGPKVWPGLLIALQFSKQILQLCFGITSFFFLLHLPPFSNALIASRWDPLWLSAIVALVIATALLAEFSMSILALVRPRVASKFFIFISSIYLFICIPLVLFFLRVLRSFFPGLTFDEKFGRKWTRERIQDILHDSELSPYLDPIDQKFILSIVSFKDRIAREVMVPRIDVFSLSADTPVHEAAQSFLKEGYSRIPIYRENVDDIVGVLLYKDILQVYAKTAFDPNLAHLLQKPIEYFLKPVLYTPETKKISHLLQEFRSKQIHLAIVVDEYGGTEGIVTIEDILEELVGEIADEYDIKEEAMYSSLPNGGWIVDARMTIIDIEEELGIKIPSSPEYDTIGGYVFHRAGSIPTIGWRIHHDAFDLEVLSSDERSIEKIRITPQINSFD